MSLAQMHCCLGRALCLKHEGSRRRRQRLTAAQTMREELPIFLEPVSTILCYRSKHRIGASKHYYSSVTRIEHWQEDSYVTCNFGSQII